jgi:hypothetical protein
MEDYSNDHCPLEAPRSSCRACSNNDYDFVTRVVPGEGPLAESQTGRAFSRKMVSDEV